MIGITKEEPADPLVIPAAASRDHRVITTPRKRQGGPDGRPKEKLHCRPLIPGGHRAPMDTIREVAVKRDKLILEEDEKQATIVPGGLRKSNPGDSAAE